MLHSFKQTSEQNNIIKFKYFWKQKGISYGPTFHQHQELPEHCESLFGGLHKVHHSTLQYSAGYGCPDTVSWFSVWMCLLNIKRSRKIKLIKRNTNKNAVRIVSTQKNHEEKTRHTKFDEGIRSGSSFNLSPINTLKFILEVFKVLKGKFLRISTVTHCQVTNASFNNITKNLRQGNIKIVPHSDTIIILTEHIEKKIRCPTYVKRKKF